MKNCLKSYIEKIIIDEHAINDELSVYEHIPYGEKKNLIELMFEHDPQTQDWLIERMQELIDQRILLRNVQRKYEHGFIPCHDNQTGEVIWKSMTR